MRFSASSLAASAPMYAMRSRLWRIFSQVAVEKLASVSARA